MKATHKGTCQICGRLQKLPKGKLSKHGYRVQWGEFSGTCPGSEEQPFEESREVLGRFVERLKGMIATFKGNVDRQYELKKSKSQEGLISGGDPVRLEVDGDGELQIIFSEIKAGRNGAERVERTRSAISCGLYDLDSAIDRFRDNAILKAERNLEHLLGDIEKQEARYKSWEPKPLMEVRA